MLAAETDPTFSLRLMINYNYAVSNARTCIRRTPCIKRTPARVRGCPFNTGFTVFNFSIYFMFCFVVSDFVNFIFCHQLVLQVPCITTAIFFRQAEVTALKYTIKHLGLTSPEYKEILVISRNTA